MFKDMFRTFVRPFGVHVECQLYIIKTISNRKERNKRWFSFGVPSLFLGGSLLFSLVSLGFPKETIRMLNDSY